MAQKRQSPKRRGSKSPAREIIKAAEDIRRGRFTTKKIVALIIALITAFAAYQYAPGRVIKVADGDTITIYTQERETKKIRLYGVDAPESKQEWGQEASDFVYDMVFLQEVELSVINKDRYGREVALVKLADGRVLNEELVKNGHAWVYRDYCKEAFCDRWIAHELAARKSKEGLWSSTKRPTAPWKWRKQNK